ncbi:putative mitochondrial inorganic pyrophosphatase [Leptomonas pyrrhocoris]|uniref:inorganic diphosphatase n=1 Tax=Leptomonas pyrrhocoris TaxID=157538 RepID=A0A0N0DQS7_LEPPY|nr:putative mitochondrial inorganic pyrophosphatase [Leptomonas pyrrhocoris]XP_015651880.1 putative mitochondrial inorganic pyrophosphatase [Leptomonas pyrrhocoris]KPA73440.1 putative mitochondrial inorganic pyrophosphatase [Leptomonas pyrrhocoris]KPA73441.1 putative mitochondrial inorganic pyrophosphatase [Leptomonas pyrrhocoris]|eukprot:XP_015651879.1 putative mitochondrial inorganic pyrophosphatase [Leptomonas pyrrhocoris]
MLHHTWLRRGSAVAALPAFQSFESGVAGTKDWRFFLRDPTRKDAVISAWHDLPLRLTPTTPTKSAAAADPRLYTSMIEIPRGTRAKMELCKEEKHNPIKQDVLTKQEGQPLRFFRYGDMPFNYGFLPRTWEDPSHKDHRTGCIGDGDPVDVVHFGPAHVLGQYDVVRVLGVLGLIDEGETDWKIIVESASPAAGDGYGSLAKVPQDVQAKILDWFENYKVPDGKPKNTFVFDKEIRGVDTALEIIEQCALQYNALMAGQCGDFGYWLR